MSDASPISREQLVEMFDDMRAQAPWDVDGPLLWGYFFFADDPAALNIISLDLVARGYRNVALYEAEDDDSPTGEFVLHVECIEQHSVDSLHQRNIELAAVAATHFARYDGMDVGPAD